MSNVTSTSKVVATSQLGPRGEMSWEVDLADPLGTYTDEELVAATLLYNNLMYDLVGAAMGKLGWEYSKLITGQQDRATFDATFEGIQESLVQR